MGGQQIGGLAGGVIGGVVGSFFPGVGTLTGASLGAALGGAVGGIIAPAKANTPEVRGPLEFQVNTFHRNLGVPVVYGIDRVAGNLIWMGNIRTAVLKRGGGKGKPETREIVYSASWAIAMSEGSIQSIGRVWINDQEVKHLPANGKSGAEVGQLAFLSTVPGWSPPPQDVLTELVPGGTSALILNNSQGNGIAITITVYAGDDVQTADPIVEKAIPIDPPLFRHTGYALVDGQIGGLPQLPNIAFELAGILTAISAGPGIQTCFYTWHPPSSWTYPPDEDMGAGPGDLAYEPFDTSYSSWLLTKSVDGESGRALAPAIGVDVDVTEDFTLSFMILTRHSFLETAVTRGGYGIGQGDYVGVASAWPMFIDVTQTSQSNVANSIYCLGVGATVLTSVRINPSLIVRENALPETLPVGTNGSPIGHGDFLHDCAGPFPDSSLKGTFTVSHGATIRVEKRGGNIKAWVNDFRFKWWLFLDTDIDEAALAASSFATGKFGIFVDNLLNQVSATITRPTWYMRDLYFCYVSTVATFLSQRGNPALIVHDFLTNTRYGMGIPTTAIDVASFAEGAIFCDEDPSSSINTLPIEPETEVVPDPESVTGDPRFRLDFSLTSRRPAADILQDMLSTFRGFLVWQGGQISLGIEKVESVTQAFSDDPDLTPAKGLMVEDSFAFSEIPSEDRPNKLRVEYIRFDDQYRRDFEPAEDLDEQETRDEIIESTIQLLGIKRSKQAKRMAQYYLDLASYVRYVCTFRVSINAMKSRVGDVISVSHTTPGWLNFGFRIVGVNEEPNEELTLSCVQYLPEIFHDEETLGNNPITQPIGADLFIAPPNVIRLRAFEARDDVEARLYITWSLDPEYVFFTDSFLFRQRDAGLFEDAGTHVQDAVTGYVDHLQYGFSGPVNNGEQPPEDITTALIAFWKLEEAGSATTWVDETVNNNDLTRVGTLISVTGQFGNAVDFDNDSANYLTIAAGGSPTALAGGNFDWTFFFWVYLDTLGTYGLINISDSGVLNDYTVEAETSGGNSAIRLQIFDGATVVITIQVSTATFPVATWTPVMVIHDAVNDRTGIKVGAASTEFLNYTVGGTPGAGTTDFTVGTRISGAKPLDGRLDQVRRYDRALTDAEFDLLVLDGVPARVLTIQAARTGSSARLFDPAGTVVTSALEIGGKIELTVTFETDPFIGHVEYYEDAAFSLLAFRGRVPATGTKSFVHFDEFTRVENEFDYSDDPTEIRMRDTIGAFPVTGDVQLGPNEASYLTFASDDEGERLSGLSWALEPDPVPVENRLSGVKIFKRVSTVYSDVTDEILAGGSVAFLEGDDDLLLIGSDAADITGLLFLLSTPASQDLVLAVKYSTDTLGSFAFFERLVEDTNGMTAQDWMNFEPLRDWTATALDPASITIGDGVLRFYVMVQRTADTVTTTPVLRRMIVSGDLLLTFQDAANRVNYLYDDDDVAAAVLGFESLAQNIGGAVADTTKRPRAEIVIQSFQATPFSVESAELDAQGPNTNFIGGDLHLNVGHAARGGGGAGSFQAGVAVGAGTQLPEPGFQQFVVDMYTVGGLFVRREGFLLVEGKGSFVYDEGVRTSDGLSTFFQLRVHQQVDGVLSRATLLDVVGTGLRGVQNMRALPSLGRYWVPNMRQVSNVRILPFVKGFRT